MEPTRTAQRRLKKKEKEKMKEHGRVMVYEHHDLVTQGPQHTHTHTLRARCAATSVFVERCDGHLA